MTLFSTVGFLVCLLIASANSYTTTTSSWLKIAKMPLMPSHLAPSSSRLYMSEGGDADYELDVGEYENVVFKKAASLSDKIGKYTLEAVVPTSALNSYLEEYKEEMKRRKVVFPGFRAGKLPPYVMGDVRKYLVCYGLETMLGTLCNNNSLKLVTETGEDVPFGEDSYYETIIKEDFRGYDFQKQRDAWKEGTPFKFSAEFFAAEEGGASAPESVGDGSVVETTAVDANAGSA